MRACVCVYIATYICYVCIIYLFVSLHVHSMREHTRVVHRLRVCRDRPVDCCERGGKIHEMRVSAHCGIQTPSLGCWLVLLLRCSSVCRSDARLAASGKNLLNKFSVGPKDCRS